ncbi:MAG TPA: CDP-alcohol phosphatidyltransferase family protein [Chloroflexota bacterium]|nr:CDP-alcohol phosphatidyltransferase family protein [Chloroflexota bacterium]
MGVYAIKPVFQRSLGGAEAWLVARRAHPDMLTAAAVALAVVGGALLWAGAWAPALLLLVPLLALGRTVLNALDGLVARRTGRARPWGEVLNEMGDRLADVALLGGLALAPTTDGRLGAAALVAVLLSSYLGVLSKAAGGPRQYGGVMGKADRMLYLALAALVAGLAGRPEWLNVYLAVVLGGALVTCAQRGRETYVALQSGR